jgi:hypothetical protein
MGKERGMVFFPTLMYGSLVMAGEGRCCPVATWGFGKTRPHFVKKAIFIELRAHRRLAGA